MIKKIISIGFLTVIVATFQIHAMIDTKTITVWFSPSAQQALGIPKEGIDIINTINITPSTTAKDVLKTIADDNNKCVRMGNQIYLNEKLKKAYQDNDLSLWTIQDRQPKDMIPLDATIKQYGNTFFIRYSVKK